MEELQQGFSYAELDKTVFQFVHERAERIHNLARMTATSIVQIGQYLTEVKERLGHGKFLGWIELEFEWSDQNARRFMHVYERFKLNNLLNMEIDISALYLIAAPKIPEPVRAEALRRAENGEAITNQSVRALVVKFAQTGEIPDIKVPLAQMIEERRNAIKPEPEPVEPESEPEQEPYLSKNDPRVQANMDRVTRIFQVIDSIERLCGTRFTARELAVEITRLDTPDKDWCGQAQEARRVLTELCEELAS